VFSLRATVRVLRDSVYDITETETEKTPAATADPFRNRTVRLAVTFTSKHYRNVYRDKRLINIDDVMG